MKTEILTDNEVKQIIEMALVHRPQTESELLRVVKEAEKMRINAQVLDAILDRKLCMFMKDGKIMIQEPKKNTRY